MGKKHKKVCGTLNYIEQSLKFFSAITGCFSISDFALLVSITIGFQVLQ